MRRTGIFAIALLLLGHTSRAGEQSGGSLPRALQRLEAPEYRAAAGVMVRAVAQLSLEERAILETPIVDYGEALTQLGDLMATNPDDHLVRSSLYGILQAERTARSLGYDTWLPASAPVLGRVSLAVAQLSTFGLRPEVAWRAGSTTLRLYAEEGSLLGSGWVEIRLLGSRQATRWALLVAAQSLPGSFAVAVDRVEPPIAGELYLSVRAPTGRMPTGRDTAQVAFARASAVVVLTGSRKGVDVIARWLDQLLSELASVRAPGEAQPSEPELLLAGDMPDAPVASIPAANILAPRADDRILVFESPQPNSAFGKVVEDDFVGEVEFVIAVLDPRVETVTVGNGVEVLTATPLNGKVAVRLALTGEKTVVNASARVEPDESHHGIIAVQTLVILRSRERDRLRSLMPGGSLVRE